jgi:mannose-1-phosphate guanylyltransferase
MKAMILAAGLGRRMAPLSSVCAKPALPVLGKPILRWLLEELAEQGVERAVVNAHAHVESVRAALRDAPLPVELSIEEKLLGSAGGIRAARRWLGGSDAFLVLNGDMLLDLDLGALLARHRSAGALATLALRDDSRKQSFGTIGYDAEGRVCRITDRISRGAESGNGLFIGVQVLEAEIFEELGPETPLELLPHLYLPLLARGAPLATWLQPLEADWWPVGDPAELLDANLRALARAAGSGALGGGSVSRGDGSRVDGEVVGPAWIGRGVCIPRGAEVGPDVVIGEGARVPAGSSWRESLLLPGARPCGRGARRRAIGFGEEVWTDA